METYRKLAYFFEHAVQNHRAAVEHLQKGDHKKATRHGYTAYDFAAQTTEVALHYSHEPSRCTPTN